MKKTFVLGMAFAFFLTSCTDDDVGELPGTALCLLLPLHRVQQI